jgi:predicted naringenin-chalcone synthase
MTTAYLNRIATAVPEHDVHDAFVVFAEQMLANPQQQARPGHRGCAMSLGPGLTAETMRFHAV